MDTEEKRQRLSPLLRRLLILKVWLVERFRFGERQVTLVWAAVIGILGALAAECFRRATDLLHWLFTGSEASIITSFERLPLWQRWLWATVSFRSEPAWSKRFRPFSPLVPALRLDERDRSFSFLHLSLR